MLENSASSSNHPGDKKSIDETRDLLRRTWGDYPLTIMIINPINLRLARLLLRTPVTPNQVTIVSFALTLVSSWCLLHIDLKYQMSGAVLLLCGYLLDCLDGDLARLKNMKSPIGAMLDPMLDRFGELAVMIAVAIHGWNRTQDYRWLVMGMVLVGSSQLYFYLVDAMLKKLPEPQRNAEKPAKPLILKKTRVRIGAIEPFVWGQAGLAFAGVAHWGVIVFGIMFSLGSIGEFFRIIYEARNLKAKKSEIYGSHFRNQ